VDCDSEVVICKNNEIPVLEKYRILFCAMSSTYAHIRGNNRKKIQDTEEYISTI
jgi:hypothetical protein